MVFENALSYVANTASAVSASVNKLFKFSHITLFVNIKKEFLFVENDLY